jgi:hypothetical protein
LSRGICRLPRGQLPALALPSSTFPSHRLFFVDLLQILLPFLSVLSHSPCLQTWLHLERSTKQTCVSADPPCPQECSRLETLGMGEQPLKRFRKNTNTGPFSYLTRPFLPVTVCSSAAAWVGLGPLGTRESSRGAEEAERDWGCGYRRTGFRRGCTRESGCRFIRFRRGLLSLMHPPLLPVSQGKRHGTGSHRFHNSVDEYEGQWASDQMHGHGVIMRGDGFSFDGMFALGLPHGQGMMMTTVCGLCAGFVF